MTFIPGAKLSALFYEEAVRPILADHFPGLKHAAALIGSGSEVLGFDDPLSTDHHWGPRVMLFVAEDCQNEIGKIHQTLADHLPYEFHGFPTNFTPPDPDDSGVQLLQPVTHGPVNHRVTLQTIRDFFIETLGFDLNQPLQPADWLTFSEQSLRSIVSGPIYHDDVGLGQACSRFAYYPRDVWIYLLAVGWARIGQEEHLMGRAGLVGDEVGSALVGARLVRDIMRLWFLMARTYAPYPKWFGTAFKQLPGALDLLPQLEAALHSRSWQEREEHLVGAYEQLAVHHNTLKITDPLPGKAIPFFGRPFRVIALHGFSKALLTAIQDERVKKIASRPPVGNIDLLSDNTDFVSNPFWQPLARKLFE